MVGPPDPSQDGTGGADAGSGSGSSSDRPNVVDSWHSVVQSGVEVFSLEYVSPHDGGLGPDAMARYGGGSGGVGVPAREAGLRYHVIVVADAVQDRVVEVTFQAPTGSWDRHWDNVGSHLTGMVSLDVE